MSDQQLTTMEVDTQGQSSLRADVSNLERSHVELEALVKQLQTTLSRQAETLDHETWFSAHIVADMSTLGERVFENNFEDIKRLQTTQKALLAQVGKLELKLAGSAHQTKQVLDHQSRITFLEHKVVLLEKQIHDLQKCDQSQFMYLCNQVHKLEEQSDCARVKLDRLELNNMAIAGPHQPDDPGYHDDDLQDLIISDTDGTAPVQACKRKLQTLGTCQQAKRQKAKPWPHKVSLGDAGYFFDYLLDSPVHHQDKHVFSAEDGHCFKMIADQHQAFHRLHNLLCPRLHRSDIPIVLPVGPNLKEFNRDHRLDQVSKTRFKRSVELYEEQLWAFHASWRMKDMKRSTFNVMIELESRGDPFRRQDQLDLESATMKDFTAQVMKTPWIRCQTQVCM